MNQQNPASILAHYGILGMHWGVRRYQNKDGTLTPKGKARLEKKDDDWAKKHSDEITKRAIKKSSKELDRYGKELLRNPDAFNKNGKLSATTIAEYNHKMSELMTQKVSDLHAPSGKAIKFVAKRGEVGVMMALADPDYNMEKLKNGVWADGRVSYKKTVLDKI